MPVSGGLGSFAVPHTAEETSYGGWEPEWLQLLARAVHVGVLNEKCPP